MSRLLAFSSVVIFALTVRSGLAFDGQRSGFILGGAVGGAFLSNKFPERLLSNQVPWMVSPSGGRYTAYEPALATEIKVGYAPSSTLELHLSWKRSWWHEDKLEYIFEKKEVTAKLDLFAIGVTKYLKNSGTGLFVTGGIGRAVLDGCSGSDRFTPGGSGFFAGAGYEFRKHLSVEATILYQQVNIDFDALAIRLTLNLLEY